MCKIFSHNISNFSNKAKNIFFFQGTYGKPQTTPGSRSPAYGNQHGGTYGSSSAPGGGDKRTFNSNLSELDTLLQDLSNAKYANNSFGSTENGINGGSLNGTYNGSGGRSPANYSRPSSAQSTLNRPSVDSLLDELNAG